MHAVPEPVLGSLPAQELADEHHPHAKPGFLRAFHAGQRIAVDCELEVGCLQRRACSVPLHAAEPKKLCARMPFVCVWCRETLRRTYMCFRACICPRPQAPPELTILEAATISRDLKEKMEALPEARTAGRLGAQVMQHGRCACSVQLSAAHPAVPCCPSALHRWRAPL